jgi:hypothetical protein
MKRDARGAFGPATPAASVVDNARSGLGRRPEAAEPRWEMSVEDEIERVRRDELVVVGVATTEPEAAVACGLLRTAGIWCASRVTNFGAGASDGLSVGGPHEILVRREDLQPARQVLRTGG